MPFRNWRGIDQPGLTVLRIGLVPTIERGPGDPKVLAGLGNMAVFFSVAKDTQLALNLAFVCVHEHLLSPKIGKLKEMSRE